MRVTYDIIKYIRKTVFTCALILALPATMFLLGACSTSNPDSSSPTNAEATNSEDAAKPNMTWDTIPSKDFIVGAWNVSDANDATGYSAHTETFSSTGICSVYDEFTMSEAESKWEIDGNVLTRTSSDGQTESFLIAISGEDTFTAEALDGADMGKTFNYVAYYRP